MDGVRELVRRRVAELGLELAPLSRAIGRNHAYLQQFLERGSPARLPEDVRALLAPLLRVEEHQLRGTADSDLSRSMAPAFPRTGTLIPVMGTAEGGTEGYLEWNGEIVDRVGAPESLQGVPSAYAVYVVGESMVPRYNPGEIAFIHPGRPITPGCFILVQLGLPEEPAGPTKRALLKQYVRTARGKLFLKQFNPDKTIEIDVSRVKQKHRIVGSTER